MRVLRVFHAGRDVALRLRDRAQTALAEVTLVVPKEWSEGAAEEILSPESFRVIELDVDRSGDVNRHSYREQHRLRSVIDEVQPDVLDILEEPFSVASRQWLVAAPPDLPVVMYTAQNLDKRFPPPFAQYETRAHRRVAALYPCTGQAASVARGKGFAGHIDVLPLGYDSSVYAAGEQSADDEEILLGLVGRFVPEKGVTDAVRVLAALTRKRPARLVLVGAGPELVSARALADSLGVDSQLEILPWQAVEQMAALYRQMHVVLIPSRATATWVEQFGRVIVEGQASGAVVAGYASGSIPEVAGPAGLLVPEGEVDALASAVVDLLADPADFARRRDDGLEQVADKTWDAVATRQVALYDRVIRGDLPPRLPLPSDPIARREIARAEFGLPARTPAGARPFALPVLRSGGPVADALGMTIDAAARLRALLSS